MFSIPLKLFCNNGFVASLRLLYWLRTSVIFMIILLSIATISVNAKSTSETKASLVAKSTCKNNNSISDVSTISSTLKRERQKNTTMIGITNQTRRDTTDQRNERKNTTRKRIDDVKTSKRNVPSTTKKRSVRTSTILRLQKEWQQMILSGVAYDWINQKPIQKRKTKESIAEDDKNETNPCLTSHIWIGPISKHQWYIWHFTFTCHDIGTMDDNPFYHGVYHGRIVLSKDYPLRPPISIQLFTPNGRFITNQNICFTSITHYHPDQWNTNSNIYSMIESLRYHMVTSKHGNEIGAVSYPSYEQKQLHASHSQSFRKLIPVQYRPSSHSLVQTKSTTHMNHNVIIIDHVNMIRNGYVIVPNSVAGNTVYDHNNTSTTNPNTQRNDDADDGTAPSFTTNKAYTVSRMDHLDARSSKRKTTNTKAKMTLKKIAPINILTRKELVRRQWKSVRHYYQCSICVFALLVFSSSVLHPLFKIFVIVTTMTLLRNALQYLIG